MRKLRKGCRRKIGIAVVLACLLSGAGPSRAFAQKAIDFVLKDMGGNPVRLSDFAGKSIVLVDFWATWCVPCVKELAHFQRFHDKYKDKGLVILAITVDGPETVAMVRPFMNRYKYTFPVLLDTESKVIALYNPRVIMPYTVIVGRDGNIKYAHQGYSPGDEIVLEEKILKLLEPEEEAKAEKYTFHASEAFLNRNFSDEEYVDRTRDGRKSQIINQLDLSLSAGDFLAGGRVDANIDFSPYKGKYSLAKRFLEYNHKDLNVRAGDFYYTVGRGMAFSVLKTFEKEGLEYIIDTTVEGGKVSFSRDKVTADVFGGWLQRENSDIHDAVYGGVLSYRYRNLADVRVNFVGSQLDKGSFFNNKTVFTESVSVDIPNIKDKAKFYGEFLLTQKTKHFTDQSYNGHGVYLESVFFLKNLSLLLEFKDYKHLDYEYSRPPLLESEQIPVMANLFITSADDITGVSTRADYSLSKINTVLYGKWTYFNDHRGKFGRDIIHAFAGAEKKFKESGWLNVLAGYRSERTTSLVFYATHGDTFHWQGNLSYPLTPRFSLELDAENKKFNGRHFDYYEWRSFLSLHYSPTWILTLFFDRTDDPEVLFFKKKENWYGAQVEVKFSQSSALKVFYGSIKGGVKCAGGVCKFFPPFEGLRIDFIYRI